MPSGNADGNAGRQVRQKRARGDCRPGARAENQQPGDGDARGRPDRRDVAVRLDQRKPELGGDEVRGRESSIEPGVSRMSVRLRVSTRETLLGERPGKRSTSGGLVRRKGWAVTLHRAGWFRSAWQHYAL